MGKEIGTNCNLIILCTSARKPVLLKEHLSDNRMEYGLHINAIGADSKGKQEFDTEIVEQMTDLIIADCKAQCTAFGELQHSANKNDKYLMQKVVEFGKVLKEEKLKKYARKGLDDRRVSVFESTGVAVQDVAIAELVFDHLSSKNCKL